MANPHRICAVPGCGKVHYGLGWCKMHYARVRTHGDPLAGPTPIGEPARYLREEVLTYEGDECLIWPYGRNEQGYAICHRDGRNHFASRLVCEDTHGQAPSPGHQAAHGCGNGHLGCVTKRHLRWATPTENKADELMHGTRCRGESAPTAKLTEDQVRAVRRLLASVTPTDVAKFYGVHPATIAAIRDGKSWAWLE